MPLIEKAFAKLHGSFHAIESGTSAEALGLLTGLPTRALDDIHKRGGEKSMSDDALFAQLRSWHSAGFILCAACGHTDRPVPEFKSLGLKHAHAYAILDVVAVGAGAANQLVKLRNPWGQGEWAGPWCDRDRSRWTAAAMRKTGFDGVDRDDGIFYMCLRDLRKYFHSVAVAKLRRNYYQMRWPVRLSAGLQPKEGHVAYVVTPSARVHVNLAMMQCTERGRYPAKSYVQCDMTLLVVELLPPGATVDVGGGGGGGPWVALAGKAGLWRELANGEGVPVGSEVSMDMASGKNFVKKAATPRAPQGGPGGAAGAITGYALRHGARLHAAGQGMESLDSVTETETWLEAGKRYLIVPWAFNNRCMGKEHDASVVLYMSAQLRPKKVAVTPEVVAGALRLFLQKHGRPEGKQKPDGTAVWCLSPGAYLVENRAPSGGRYSHATFTLKVTKIEGILSSRHGRQIPRGVKVSAAKTVDTIPPRSWQIVNWWVPCESAWSWGSGWSTTWDGPQQEGHEPATVPRGGIHGVYPLDA